MRTVSESVRQCHNRSVNKPGGGGSIVNRRLRTVPRPSMDIFMAIHCLLWEDARCADRLGNSTLGVRAWNLKNLYDKPNKRKEFVSREDCRVLRHFPSRRVDRGTLCTWKSLRFHPVVSRLRPADQGVGKASPQDALFSPQVCSAVTLALIWKSFIYLCTSRVSST